MSESMSRNSSSIASPLHCVHMIRPTTWAPNIVELKGSLLVLSHGITAMAAGHLLLPCIMGDRWHLRRGIMTLIALACWLEHLDVSNKNHHADSGFSTTLSAWNNRYPWSHFPPDWNMVLIFPRLHTASDSKSMTNSTGGLYLNAHASMGRSHTDRYWPSPVASSFPSFQTIDRAFD